MEYEDSVDGEEDGMTMEDWSNVALIVTAVVMTQNWLLNLLLAFALTALWGMLNTMQLIVHLLLIPL